MAKHVLWATIMIPLITIGCTNPAGAPTSKPKESASSGSDATKAADANQVSTQKKRPKFEAEMIHTHTLDGGTGSSSHKTVYYDGGKPFRCVENVVSKTKGKEVEVICSVKFMEHRDGADVYEVTHEIRKPKGSETQSMNVSYKGQKLVALKNEYSEIVLQPPTDEPAKK